MKDDVAITTPSVGGEHGAPFTTKSVCIGGPKVSDFARAIIPWKFGEDSVTYSRGRKKIDEVNKYSCVVSVLINVLVFL